MAPVDCAPFDYLSVSGRPVGHDLPLFFELEAATEPKLWKVTTAAKAEAATVDFENMLVEW